MTKSTSCCRRDRIRALALLAVLIALPGLLQAQEPMEGRGLQMSRDQLEAVLERYEEAASSPGYSSELRAQARREAELIRRRLVEGDFQVGDRIFLQLRGPRFTADTLVVQPDRTIEVGEIGGISLEGLLRSELEPYLREELSRYIREPEVRAESLIRVSVMGQVNRPGFMVLPASMLLEDAIMAAGGPGQGADLDEMTIERSGEEIWEGAALQEALVEGRTLDQLNLRAGDRIQVPQEQPGFFSRGIVRTLLFTLPPLILVTTRLLNIF